MIDSDGVTLRLMTEPTGVAALVDDVLVLLSELQVRGYRPARLEVRSDLYRELADVKWRELRRPLPLFLLGLEVLPESPT